MSIGPSIALLFAAQGRETLHSKYGQGLKYCLWRILDPAVYFVEAVIACCLDSDDLLGQTWSNIRVLSDQATLEIQRKNK